MVLYQLCDVQRGLNLPRRVVLDQFSGFSGGSHLPIWVVLRQPIDEGIQKFGIINGVDNVNWPPYKDSKS